MIKSIQQGLKDDGVEVPIIQFPKRFGVSRRTVYNKPVKKVPVVQECFARPIKDMIEENPSFGYRTVAGLASTPLGPWSHC